MSMDDILTKNDLLEITSQMGTINKNIAVLNTEVTYVKNLLVAQNGKVKENSSDINGLKIEFAALEATHKTDQKYTEKNQDKSDKRIFDIIKENGSIILTVFVIISTILSWIK